MSKQTTNNNQQQTLSLKRSLLIKIVGYTGVLLSVGIITLALFLGTNTSRVTLARAVFSLVSSDTLSISVTGLNSPELLHWTFNKLTILHKNKPWLIAESGEIAANSRSLLAKKLDVTQLNFQSVEYFHNQSPLNTPTEQPRQEKAPLKLWPVWIKTARIEHLTIHEKHNPLPASYQVSATATLFQKEQKDNAHIDITSLDPTQLQVSVNIANTKDSTYALKGNLSENSHGLFGKLIRWPESENIAAQFNASYKKNGSTFVFNNIHILTQLFAYQLELKAHLLFNKENNNALDISEGVLIVDSQPSEFYYSSENTASEYTINTAATLNALPFELINPWLPHITLPNKGEATGKIRFAGDIFPLFSTKTPEEILRAANHWQSDIQLTTQQHLNNKQRTFHGGLQVQSTLSNGVLTVDTLEISFNQLNRNSSPTTLALTGKANLSSGDTHIQVASHNIHNNILSPLFKHYSIQNLELDINQLFLSGSGNIYPLFDNNWNHLNLDLQTKVTGKYLTRQLTANTKASLKNSHLTVKSFSANWLNSIIDLHGKVDLHNKGEDTKLHYAFSPVALHQLKHIFQQEPLNLTFNSAFAKDTTGNIQAHGTVLGQITNPTITAQATATINHRQGPPITVDAKGQWFKKTLSFAALNLQQPSNQLNAQGQGSLVFNKTIPAINAQLSAHKIPGEWLASLGWPDSMGTLSMDVDWSSKATQNLNTPAQFTHWLNTLSTTANIDYITRHRKKNIQWQTTLNTHALLQLASTLTVNGETTGVIKGSAAFSDLSNSIFNPQQLPTTTLDISAELADIAFALPPEHTVTGKVTAALLLAGSRQKPTLNGAITLAQGTYENQALDINLNSITLAAQAQGATLRVNRLTATDGTEGSIVMQGLLQWPESPATQVANFNLQLNNASLMNTDQASGRFSGDLTLTGNRDALLLTGDIALSPFYVSLNNHVSSAVPEIRVQYAKSQHAESTFNFPVLYLDLNVDVDHQAYIEGRGLYSELEGSLRLRGPTNNITYSGDVKTVRGMFELFGKRFDLESGNLGFSNNTAVLSVTGLHQGRDIEITANVSGTTEELDIQFTSSPPLPQDEIIARLIFGRSIQEMSALQALQLASAIQTLRGEEGQFDVLGSARNFLQVDTLTIDSQENDAGEQGVAIGAGKYLSDKIYVEVEHSSESTTPWLGNIYIELTPSISLESTTGSSDEGATSKIIWKRDY